MKKFYVSMFTLVVITLMSFPLWAQKVTVKVIQGKDKVVYKKNTSVDFDETNVDGDLIKPQGNYYQARGRAKFNSLIQYRANFQKEMMKSAKKL